MTAIGAAESDRGATSGQHAAPIGPSETVLGAAVRRGPGKLPGHAKPADSGRKPGTPNKRTIAMADLVRPAIPKAKRALLRLLESADGELVYKSAALLMAYFGGRPPEAKTVQVGGIPGQPIETDSTTRTLDMTSTALRLANQLGMPVTLAGQPVHVPDALAAEIDAPVLTHDAIESDNGLQNPLHEAARRIAWLLDRGGEDLTARLGHAAQLPSPAAQDCAGQDADVPPLSPQRRTARSRWRPSCGLCGHGCR